MMTMARDGTGQIVEPEASSGSSRWVTGAQVLEQFATPLPDILAGSWTGSGAAGT